MKKLTFFILFLLTAPVQAVDFYLHGASYHTHGRDKLFNQRNPGLGVAFKISDNKQAEAGTYKNSESGQSTYVGVQHRLFKAKAIEAGLEYMAVHGYKSVKVAPVVAPYVQAGNLRTIILPLPEYVTFGFSLRY